jgi:hypothetical protein
MSERDTPPDIAIAFADDELIARAFAAADAAAARRHKQAGVPMVAWEDGHVVLIPPSEIVVPDDGKDQAA